MSPLANLIKLTGTNGVHWKCHFIILTMKMINCHLLIQNVLLNKHNDNDNNNCTLFVIIDGL